MDCFFKYHRRKFNKEFFFRVCKRVETEAAGNRIFKAVFNMDSVFCANKQKCWTKYNVAIIVAFICLHTFPSSIKLKKTHSKWKDIISWASAQNDLIYICNSLGVNHFSQDWRDYLNFWFNIARCLMKEKYWIKKSFRNKFTFIEC